MGNTESTAAVAPGPPDGSLPSMPTYTPIEPVGPGDLASGSLPEAHGGGSATVSPASSRRPSANAIPKLRPSLFGSHSANMKGEDGLRVDRLTIGGDVFTAALVVDGHGGHDAAALVVDQLPAVFAKYARSDASSENLQAAASEAFLHLHEQMQSSAFESTSGTTATLCLINETRGEITACSVGDSFAILVAPPAQRDLRTTELTSNPRLDDNESERERVKLAGGRIGKASTAEGLPCGPLRAWPGGITCASSLGDSDCGQLINPKPHCMRVAMPESGAIILASDGLWDAVTFSTATKVALGSKDPAHAAERLVGKSLRSRGLRDDITVVVVVCGNHRSGAIGQGELPSDASSSAPAAAEAAGATGTPGDKRPSKTSPRLSRFRMPSMLRAPKTIEAGARDVSVKGGKIFESLAAMAPDVLLPPDVTDLSSLDHIPEASELANGRGGREHSNSSSSNESVHSNSLFQLKGEGCESPEPMPSDQSPLFGSLELSPQLCISPSGSRESLVEADAAPAGSSSGSGSSPSIARLSGKAEGGGYETPPRRPPRTNLAVAL